MSINKIIIIFGLLLVIFGVIAFYQFGTKANQTTSMKTNGKATIGKYAFAVEVVKTPKDQQIGLTKYSTIKDNQGMLFIFEKPNYYNFWMKNMKFPIDIIFINGRTVVSFVENATPPASNTKPPLYKPTGTVDKVLEIKAGLIKKYNIKEGDIVQVTM